MNKKTDGDRKSGVLALRLKSGDRELFEGRAKEEGKKLTVWARDSLVALAKVDGSIARNIVRSAIDRVPGILEPLTPEEAKAHVEAGYKHKRVDVPLDENGNIRSGHFTIPAKNMSAYT